MSFLACLLLFWQALEEAAANAAEEEKRRLQTQTELQDRYRRDLEREKLVCQSFSSACNVYNVQSSIVVPVGLNIIHGCFLCTITTNL